MSAQSVGFDLGLGLKVLSGDPVSGADPDL